MNSLMHLLEGPVPQSIGWTLLHHLWQATLIALIAAACLALMRRQSANARYLVACGSLLLMMVFPLATAFRVYEPAMALVEMEPSGVALEASESEFAWSTSAAETPSLLVRAQRIAAPWLPWIVAVWFTGVAILSGRLMMGWIQTRRLRWSGQMVPAEWSATLRRLAALLRMRQAVRILQSSRIEVPMVIGWLRPVILVPASALTGLSAQQLETILAHELAHIQRHDYLVNLVQSVAETLFFYHPAVWWLSSRIRVERENCCDDLAVAACGNPVLYARALANLEGLRAETHALAATGGTLRERVVRLVSGPSTHCSYRWVAGMSILTLIAAAAVAAPLAFLNQEPAASEPAEEMNIVELPAEVSAEPTVAQPAGETPAVPLPAVPLPAVPVVEDSTEEFEIPGSEIEIQPGIGVTIRSVAGTAVPATTFTLTSQDLAAITTMAIQVAEQVTPEPPGKPVRRRSRRWDGELTIDQLIALKEAGVDAKYIRDLRTLGYGDLSFDDLIQLRQQGVDPEYIAKMNKIGHGHLAADQLVNLRNAGVTPTYVEEMTRAGLGRLKVDELIEARTHGLTSAFIDALREAGLENLSLADILRLYKSGISIEFVRELKKKKNVSWNNEHETSSCASATRAG